MTTMAEEKIPVETVPITTNTDSVDEVRAGDDKTSTDEVSHSTIGNAYRSWLSLLSQLKAYVPHHVYDTDVTKLKNSTNTEKSEGGDRYRLYILPPATGGTFRKGSKKRASLFPESLAYQTLACFSTLKDSIDLHYTTVFQSSPTENLPYLLTPDGKALVGDELRDLLLYGQKEPDQVNPSLETRALLHLIESSIGATILYFFYLDPDYFDYKILPYLSGDLSWPISWISSQMVRQQTITTLLKRHSVLDKDTLLLDSSEALKVLETLLQSQTTTTTTQESQEISEVSYFSNTSTPGWLDAVVFAHFHTMTTAFPQHHSLRDLAQGFPLLQKHTTQLHHQYFPKPSKK